VSSFLHSVVSQVQGKAGVAGIAGIIGILLALWSASGYVAAFMRAANAIYDVDEGRPIWKTAPVRLLTTLALVIMLVIAAAIVVLTGPIANQVGSAFGIGSTAVLIWEIAKWPVLVVIVSLMLTLLYRATPNVKQPGFRWISAGGVLAVLVWVIASGLFALYVSFSGSYNKTYGSLATVIVFLVWLWITNIAILLAPNSTPKPNASEPSEPDCPTTSNRSQNCATPANSTSRKDPRRTRRPVTSQVHE
jgi:membrane protein